MDMNLYALCKTYADNLVKGGGAIQGISVVDLEINNENHLICYLSNATTIDAGLIDTIVGPPGDKGEPGLGISIGGTTGQVLTKKSDTDYDTEWKDVDSGTGDMVKSIYDPTAKNTDAFNMDNMSDGTNYVKTENNFTDTEKIKLGNIAENANVSGVNTGDETNETILAKIGYTPEDVADKGQALGYCALDGGGKVPLANLPATLLKYVGTWNASTNTPTLTNPDVTKIGNVYNVSVAGIQFGITFSLGDWLIYNASGIPEKSDNADDIVSVNGKTGTVVLTTSDIADSTNKRYITDTQQTNLHTHSNKTVIDGISSANVIDWSDAMNLKRANDGSSFEGVSPRDADTLGGNLPSYFATANSVTTINSFLGVDITKLANAYSASSTYGLGAYVIYNSKLYRCTTAITVAEAWTISHWTESNFVEWSALRCVGTITKGTMISTLTYSVLEKKGGRVDISYAGLLNTGTTGNQIIGTIPVGYRPVQEMITSCQLISNVNGVIGNVVIDIYGNLNCSYAMTNGSYVLFTMSYCTNN